MWAEPSTKLQLIQKNDPLVKKPYGTIQDQVQPALSQISLNDSETGHDCLPSQEKQNTDYETPIPLTTNN